MRKLLKILTSMSLCAALVTTGAAAALAGTSVQTGQKADAPAVATPLSQTRNIKNETVYVLAGADGAVENIIVSDWIRNTGGDGTIRDLSGLSGIENVKGDENCASDGNGGLVWEARGEDVYYQGTIEKELPVELAVSYTLNGEAISPRELAGRSGRVTIRFACTAALYETVELDGGQTQIPVPFAVVTGLLLDGDRFTNVQVSNGKLVNDGDRIYVAGLAFPGLQEALALDRQKLEIPEFVEITADVTDFRLGMTLSVATNSVFAQLDPDKISLENAEEALRELTDGMEQLLNGSSELYEGLCTLREKSDALLSGAEQLAQGAGKLQQGAASLDSGVKKLQAGASQLQTGLESLSGSSGQLTGGARQVFDTLLATATAQLRAAGIETVDLTVENYGETLSSIMAGLEETAVYEQALSQVTRAVEAQRPLIEEKVTAAVQEQVTQQVTQAILAQVGSEQAMQNPQLQALVQEEVRRQMESETVRRLIEENTRQQMEQAVADAMAGEAVLAQLAAAAQGRQSVQELKQSLDSYRQFYQGVLDYTQGVDAAATGAETLVAGCGDLTDGTAELVRGTDSLAEGIASLQDGLPALVDGVRQLRDGAMELSDGLKKLDEEGISRLTQLLQEDGRELLDRVRAIVEVSRGYSNFSGIGQEMDGQLKFVYRTAEIEPED